MRTAGSLHLPGSGPLHRLPSHTKVVAALALVVAVVASPREAVWAHAAFLGLVLGVARAGGIAPGALLRRVVVVLPVVAAVLLLPLVAEGPRVEVLGLVHLSRDGLWAAWNVLAKATLSLLATQLLVATTTIPDLLKGLERLRVPPVFTAIATFMVRYVEVVGQELHRMQIARISRAHDPRWLWQARAVASSAGSLFVRSFERGERVHQAMVSRGFDGTLHPTGLPAATGAQWCLALSVPVAAAVLSGAAWVAA